MFPGDFSKELVLRIWAIMSIPAFFTCMRGIPYISAEKINFFNGVGTVEYPRTGRRYNVYKKSGVMAYNKAIFVNANLPDGTPRYDRL